MAEVLEVLDEVVEQMSKVMGTLIGERELAKPGMEKIES